MRVSDVAPGRDNNFNLIRIGAALAVLVSHSFPFALGIGADEPGRRSLGMSLGSIAVDVFFVTSGFLVTASLARSRTLLEFAIARILRIFPALIVVVLCTVFGLGLYFTTSSAPAYLADSRTHQYLIKCSTLLFGVTFDLPGVFERNPYPQAVNGSLWTLTPEVRVYAILAMVWVGARMAARPERTFRAAVIGCALAALLFVLATHFGARPRENAFSLLLLMFFAGAACYVMRERIVLSRTISLALAAVLTGCGIAREQSLFFLVYVASLPYLLLTAAYLPSGLIRRYNRAGDYSYGLYLLAAPVQQSLAALVPGITVPRMVLLTSLLAVSLATLSWRCIERPALSFKARYRARAPRGRTAIA